MCVSVDCAYGVSAVDKLPAQAGKFVAVTLGHLSQGQERTSIGAALGSVAHRLSESPAVPVQAPAPKRAIEAVR